MVSKILPWPNIAPADGQIDGMEHFALQVKQTSTRLHGMRTTMLIILSMTRITYDSAFYTA